MRLPTLVAIAIAVASPAFGESTSPHNPGGTPPGSRHSAAGAPGPHQANESDRAFIHAAAIGGLAEVELGRLAAQKAASRAVKEFAEHMGRDHGAANDKLATLAKADGIMLPDALDGEHKAMRARLEHAADAQFDHAYIEGQIAEHQETAQLLEYEINSGENADLKKFASDLLPTVLTHLRMARAVASGLVHQAKADASPKESHRVQR